MFLLILSQSSPHLGRLQAPVQELAFFLLALPPHCVLLPLRTHDLPVVRWRAHRKRLSTDAPLLAVYLANAVRSFDAVIHRAEVRHRAAFAFLKRRTNDLRQGLVQLRELLVALANRRVPCVVVDLLFDHSRFLPLPFLLDVSIFACLVLTRLRATDAIQQSG